MPVLATHVANAYPVETRQLTGPEHALARLNTSERDYVRSLKRRDRNEVVRLLSCEKRARSTVPLRIQVLQSSLPDDVKMRIFDEIRTAGCEEKYVTWVRRALELPLGRSCATPYPKYMNVPDCVARASRAMEAHVTGHTTAKAEVLKLLCQSRVGGTGASGYAIGLEGPPGCGKTHFVRTAVAAALGRPLVTIPLGGATDLSYLLGSVYTYEGSRHGRLAMALIEAGCENPIVYFDELDKVSNTDKGAEIVSTLIHLCDPSANTALRDRYFHGIDLDFSKCTFLFSYNSAAKISPILLDRIKRVAMPAPSDAERADIVRAHILPRAQARRTRSSRSPTRQWRCCCGAPPAGYAASRRRWTTCSRRAAVRGGAQRAVSLRR